jgi:hypothetical protein
MKEPKTVTITTPGAPAEYRAYLESVMRTQGVLPQPSRGVPIQPPTQAIPLSGIGVDLSGRGTATRMILNPRLAADLGHQLPTGQVELGRQGASPVKAAAVQEAIKTAGIPVGERTMPQRVGDRLVGGGYSGEVPRMNPNVDNNIVVFYENKKTGKIHVRIQAPGDKFQVIDRVALPEHVARYSRQWSNFEDGKESRPEGTPLSKLYPQQPTLVKQIEEQNVTTVEQLAHLPDPGIEAIAYLGGGERVQEATKYLADLPVKERDEKIAALEKERDVAQKERDEFKMLAETPAPSGEPDKARPRKRKEIH